MKIILSTLNAKYIHSSLALRYLKAYNQKDFKEIELVEYSIKEPIMNMLGDLYQKKPDVIGFSCYIWNIEETIDLIKLVKKVLPAVRIIVGGPEVSYDIPFWLKKVEEIDFIVYGEGEHSFNQLLKALKDNKVWDDIKGIAFMEEQDCRVNPPQPKLDLNDLPSPYYDENDIAILKDKIVYYEASRGCPFSCAYCLSSIETGVRYFSIERVKTDLKMLIDNGVKTVKFVDRTFNTNKRFALKIFDFLVENNNGTIFQFEITADIMHRDVINFLINKAPKGIFRFEVGVQSTNEYTNSLINRRQNFRRLSETVLKLKQNKGIDLHLDLIAGLPEEDYDSFKRTFNDVFELRPEELQLGFLKILRGTQIWHEAKKYDYVYLEKAPYEMLKNNVLSFNDVIKIKQVEDVLDKYWNNHRMDNTIEYLIRNEYTTPFDFFQDFGGYWEDKGWNRIGHQLEALFERLYKYLLNRKTKNIQFIEALMKIDYFLNHNYKPRKTWWDFNLTKQQQANYLKSLVEKPQLVSNNFIKLNLDEKNINKHVMIEHANFNLEAYFNSGNIIEGNTLIIVYFDSPNKPKYFFKKLD